MNILLIEPDKDLAKTYKEHLENKGHQVFMCAVAQEAIANSDETVPDVIVLELLLGEHNGVEFLYEFRSYPEWRSVPVVLLSMLSPHELQIYRHSLELLEVNVCLYKPTTSLDQLASAVRKAGQITHFI